MYKRNLYIVGLVGSLGMLSFIIGVWNGVTIKTKRTPDVLGYQIDDNIQLQNAENLLPNRNSRGK